MPARYRLMLISLLLLAAAGLHACNGLNGEATDAAIKASGTITAETIRVAPEIGGRVIAIHAAKGDQVKAGAELFRLDDSLAKAQLEQAAAAVTAAQAALEAAQAQTAAAQAQYEQALLTARLQDQHTRTAAWTATQPAPMNMPAWYFEKSEQMAALNTLLEAAQSTLKTEQDNLDRELRAAAGSDFIAAEKRLAEAQQAYLAANATLEKAKVADKPAELIDAAQKVVDSTRTELEAAQKAYERLLSTDAARKVREARARVAVARENLFALQDARNRLATGEEAPAVAVAQTMLKQAQIGQSQAEAALAQAQAAHQLAKVQLAKTVVSAEADGVVLARPLNVGEFAAPGTTVLEIGKLDPLILTVYIPESEYGRITLGQKATITVDSFPGRTFEGTVTYIADQAEFTPRNIQTAESRSTTVYKVEITIPNSNGELKPGMPADATLYPGR